MKKKTARYLLAAVLASVILTTASCRERGTADGEEPPETATEQDTEAVLLSSEGKTENLLREYYALLITTKDKEDIYHFIEDNIKKAKPKDADQLVNGLIGYLADAGAADYNRLSRQEDYLTEEMREFIELMRQEQNSPAIFGREVRVSLPSLLLRAKNLEEHARSYPEGVTFVYTYEKYCELLSAAVTGFYDGASDWSNCYLDADQIHIEEAAVSAYADFAALYPDSHTAGILREYLRILEENDCIFTKAVKKFYGKIYTVIKENFPIES